MAQSNLLDQFRALISKSPLPLSTDRLVQVGKKIFDNVLKIFPFDQIMALNMFSIEETKLRSGSSSATTPTTYRSVAQVTIITIRVSAEYFFSISILIFDNLHTYSY